MKLCLTRKEWADTGLVFIPYRVVNILLTTLYGLTMESLSARFLRASVIKIDYDFCFYIQLCFIALAFTNFNIIQHFIALTCSPTY